jgi:FkbM family methyltransferase
MARRKAKNTMVDVETTEERTISSSKNFNDKMQLFHVGGVGGIGPAAVLYVLGANGLHQTIFEADNDQPAPASPIPTTIIPKCIWSEEGPLSFHCMWKPLASSVYPGSKKNAKLQRQDVNHRLVIEEMCCCVKKVEVQATTLNKLIENKEVPIPDFLSMDVQGGELDVMKGSTDAFESDLLGVCTEVEFQELYEGQPLFADQDTFLRQYEFSLYEFYNVERWYPGLIMGQGAFTVAEAVYFRDIAWFEKRYANDKKSLLERLMKLAIVTNYFGYISYGLKILDHISIYLNDIYHEFQHSPEECWFRNELIKYHTQMCSNRVPYEKTPSWAQDMKFDISTGIK